MSQSIDTPTVLDNSLSDEAKAKTPKKIKQPCRFYNSKSGCRAGPACRYLHEESVAKRKAANGLTQITVPKNTDQTPQNTAKHGTQHTFQAPVVAQSRIVSRPTPKTQEIDPREFQLGQIRRRFKPEEKSLSDGTSFSFNLVPSDPDFPFDIEALECVLTVPLDYPQDGRPKLRISNKEMQRGFQLNVEQGFGEFAAASPNATLLGLMNRLDKDLADVLSRPMAQTIKLYRNVNEFSQTQPTAPTIEVPIREPAREIQVANQAAPSFSSAEREKAATKRQAEIRQLVARLGKMPNFKQSADGVTFTVPFLPPKKASTPESLQNVNVLRLIVPELYNLTPCRIEFPGCKDQATKAVERAFEERARAEKEATLLTHINYMSQHLGQMAKSNSVSDLPASKPDITEPLIEPEAQVPKRSKNAVDNDRSHIQVIQRPPEWAYSAAIGDDGSSDESSDYDSESDLEHTDEDNKETATASASQMPTTGPAEKAILLSFPALELYGIELLELTSLSITLKCDRCKEQQDITGIRNNAKAERSGLKEQSCKKCANNLAAGFRMDLMHTNSARAGYLDLDGCIPVDMLPSTFVPTCSECSTSYTTPGCVSVRGESTLAVCRECHRKMTFRIPEVKFLTVSAAAERATRATGRRRAKENLGIVAGQELPRRGRCSHYAKSYRWFRFSCCSKVYPCDRCHDEASDHPNEHANRMICGYCSREQNYRPEDCGICHSVLIGRRGHGFWEGGKGTRDKARMSRKDPRKYKRRPGAKPKEAWKKVE